MQDLSVDLDTACWTLGALKVVAPGEIRETRDTVWLYSIGTWHDAIVGRWHIYQALRFGCTPLQPTVSGSCIYSLGLHGAGDQVLGTALRRYTAQGYSTSFWVTRWSCYRSFAGACSAHSVLCRTRRMCKAVPTRRRCTMCMAALPLCQPLTPRMAVQTLLHCQSITDTPRARTLSPRLQ